MIKEFLEKKNARLIAKRDALSAKGLNSTDAAEVRAITDQVAELNEEIEEIRAELAEIEAEEVRKRVYRSSHFYYVFYIRYVGKF